MELEPGCVERCPGCRYRALPPEESDRRKAEWAQRWLTPFGAPLVPLKTPRQRWGYRRKALLHASAAGGGWQFGLLRRLPENRRLAELVSIPDCPVHDPVLNERLKVLRSLIPFNAPLVFVQASGGIFTLVFKCARSAAWVEWARTLEAPLFAAGVEALFLNWNPAAGRRALSARHQERIFGEELIKSDGHFHGAMSFRQQIPEVENYALAIAENFLAGTDPIADLYCGAGASLARWRARGMQAVGVELVAEACRAAERNAPGAMVLKGRVEDRLPQLDTFLGSSPFALYTNPPRDGHAPVILAWIQQRAPARIAYLSCNARSLAHDLDQLKDSYQTLTALPFDFFPQTDHVECLALLQRR